jgi:peptidoglycan hydrolase CwlO-like protein
MTRDLDSLNKELNSRSSLKSKEIDSLEDKVKTHLQRVKEKDQEIQKLLGKIDKLERE